MTTFQSVVFVTHLKGENALFIQIYTNSLFQTF